MRDTLLGSAYVITPDKGSFLERFYADLGLDQIKRESFPPDPMELGGTVEEDFWSGTGVTSAELRAFERYGRVVRYMGCEAYPEIPLSDDRVAQLQRFCPQTEMAQHLKRVPR